MSASIESDSSVPPRRLRVAGPFHRIIALVGGLLLLGIGMVVSFGLVLVGPVALGVAALVQRRRRRPLTWIAGATAAGGAVAVAVLLAAGAVGAAVPRDTWRAVQHAADSASMASAQTPPPAWVTRLVPGAGALPAQTSAGAPRISTSMLVIGGATAVMIFATMYGALGWGAGMLLGFALVGRWPGARAAVDVEGGDA